MGDCWPEQEAVEKWFDEYVRDKYKIFHSNKNLMELKEAVTKTRIEMQNQLSEANDRIQELENQRDLYKRNFISAGKTNEYNNKSIDRLCDAIISLMPILQQWEPDHSSPEDRNAWRKAQALVSEIKGNNNATTK